MPNTEDTILDNHAGYGMPSAAPIPTSSFSSPYLEVWYQGHTYRMYGVLDAEGQGEYRIWGGTPAWWQHVDHWWVPMFVIDRFDLMAKQAFARAASRLGDAR